MDNTATIATETDSNQQIEFADPDAAQEAAQLRLQLMFLKRLAHLAEIRNAAQAREADPSVLRLIDSSLYSTYWDCARLGRRDEARLVLRLPEQDQTDATTKVPGDLLIDRDTKLSQQPA